MGCGASAPAAGGAGHATSVAVGGPAPEDGSTQGQQSAAAPSAGSTGIGQTHDHAGQRGAPGQSPQTAAVPSAADAEPRRQAICHATQHLKVAARTVAGVERFKSSRQLICGGKPVGKVGLKEGEPKRIVFIGCTGTGKSSLCTALTGQGKASTSFRVGKGAKSETTQSLAAEHNWLGDKTMPRFKCIDTPGLNDSEGQDEHHIADIISKMTEME